MPQHRLPSKSMLQWVASFTTIVSRKMFSQSCAYSDARPIYSYTVRRLSWFSNKSHSRRIPKSSTTQSTQQQNKIQNAKTKARPKKGVSTSEACAKHKQTQFAYTQWYQITSANSFLKHKNLTEQKYHKQQLIWQQTASNTSNHLHKQANTCHVALDRR